jgi:hypothetical protein
MPSEDPCLRGLRSYKNYFLQRAPVDKYYDCFRGDCPHCHKKIDCHPEWGRFDDIQTTRFIQSVQDLDRCFRSFRPGDTVPYLPEDEEFVIGRTDCCGSYIKACFDGRILSHYVVASQDEIDEWLGEEEEQAVTVVDSEDICVALIA